MLDLGLKSHFPRILALFFFTMGGTWMAACARFTRLRGRAFVWAARCVAALPFKCHVLDISHARSSPPLSLDLLPSLSRRLYLSHQEYTSCSVSISQIPRSAPIAKSLARLQNPGFREEGRWVNMAVFAVLLARVNLQNSPLHHSPPQYSPTRIGRG